MSTFKVGEKVVVKDLSSNKGFYPYGIKKNEIYEIQSISNCKCGKQIILLYGTDNAALKTCAECGTNGLPCNAFYSWRFRKLDYDFAENLLAQIKEEVQSEYQLN